MTLLTTLVRLGNGQRVAVLLLSAFAGACVAAPDGPAPRHQPRATVPPATPSATAPGAGLVVLELFTSQGCSSCPPADAVLAGLADAGQLAGRAVLPLAFHVDYWDGLGWEDPFGAAAWSERQRAYTRARGDDQLYTPQVVVAGGAHVLGSSRNRIAAAVRAAPPSLAVDASATRVGDRLDVRGHAPGGAALWVVLWQATASTVITRGENVGTTGISRNIVRQIAPLADADRDGEAHLVIDPAWGPIGAAALAVDDHGAIVGATRLPAS